MNFQLLDPVTGDVAGKAAIDIVANSRRRLRLFGSGLLLLRLGRRRLFPPGDGCGVIFAAEMRFHFGSVGEAEPAEEAEVGVILDADLRLRTTVGRAQTSVDRQKLGR